MQAIQEAGRQDKTAVIKRMAGKIVEVGGDRMGYSLRGEWQWTQAATRRYPEETLTMGKAYVDE